MQDKKVLAEALRKAVDAAVLFCANKGVVLAAIEQLPAGDMRRLQRVADAVDALISPDPLRREFLGHERLVNTLHNAVKPDPTALEFAGRVACLAAIAAAIHAKLNPNPVDISEVMGDVAKLLDASITGVGMPTKPAPALDLSKIDFEALRLRFKEVKHKNTDLHVRRVDSDRFRLASGLVMAAIILARITGSCQFARFARDRGDARFKILRAIRSAACNSRGDNIWSSGTRGTFGSGSFSSRRKIVSKSNSTIGTLSLSPGPWPPTHPNPSDNGSSLPFLGDHVAPALPKMASPINQRTVIFLLSLKNPCSSVSIRG